MSRIVDLESDAKFSFTIFGKGKRTYWHCFNERNPWSICFLGRSGLARSFTSRIGREDSGYNSSYKQSGLYPAISIPMLLIFAFFGMRSHLDGWKRDNVSLYYAGLVFFVVTASAAGIIALGGTFDLFR